MTSHFRHVPVVDVHSDNFKDVWPSLTLAIKTATFIAIDTELSGLGNKRLLNARSIDDRYSSVSNVAKTRSIIALGISCFKLNTVKNQQANSDVTSNDKSVTIKQWSFLVQTFNIVVLCGEEYVVEPSSLKFLIAHGFDFNKQYSTGISYYRGNDRQTTKPSLSVRDLFSVLLESDTPVVFHNALVDLIFLYQSFYANLPSSCSTFLADLTEMFTGGIYDTKYITEYRERLTASYLEFVFRKCQRANAYRCLEWRTQVCLEFVRYPDSCSDVTLRFCGLPNVAVELGHIPDKEHLHKILCDIFASHGWCPRDTKCHQSHDIDMIIDFEGLKMCSRRRKRKRRQKDNSDNTGSMDVPANEDGSTVSTREELKNNNQTPGSKEYNDEGEENVTSVDTASEVDISCDSYKEINENSYTDRSKSKMGTYNSTKDESVSSSLDGSKSSMDGSEFRTDGSKSNTDGSKFSMDRTKSNTDGCESSFPDSCPEFVRCSKESVVEEARSGGHRAGYDAFMTGFSMAFFASKYGKLPENNHDKITLSNLGLDDMKNKIYLCGKDIPMSISKSAFTKTSKDHREKIQKLRQPSVV